MAYEVDWAMQGGETPHDARVAAGRRDGKTGGARGGGGGRAEVEGPAFGRRSEDEVDEPGRGGGGGAKPLPVEAAGTFPAPILPFAARLAGAAVAVTVDVAAEVAEGPEAGGGSAKVMGGYGFAPFGLEEDDPFTADVVVPAAAPCPSAGAI